VEEAWRRAGGALEGATGSVGFGSVGFGFMFHGETFSFLSYGTGRSRRRKLPCEPGEAIARSEFASTVDEINRYVLVVEIAHLSENTCQSCILV